MTFNLKEKDILQVDTGDYLLEFRIVDILIEIEEGEYKIGFPINYLELYPSGEENVLIFKYNSKDNTYLGFEDDFELSAKVIEKAQEYSF